MYLTLGQLLHVLTLSLPRLYFYIPPSQVCQFPPYVYRRLAEQGRGVLLVLNKVDLVPASVILAWKQYFENLCPGLQVGRLQ